MKFIFTEKGFLSFELLMLAAGAAWLFVAVVRILAGVANHEHAVILEEAALRGKLSGIETPCLETVEPERFKICN